jgi:hypothetical protein
MEARVRGWMAATAELHGFGAGRAAEVFQLVQTR